MKKSSYLCISLVIIAFMIISILIFVQNNIITGPTEIDMKQYYSEKDFESIIIRKSTFYDVYKIAPITEMEITSYGGICEIPLKDDGSIIIKFYGNDLIVGSIDIVNNQNSTLKVNR